MENGLVIIAMLVPRKPARIAAFSAYPVTKRIGKAGNVCQATSGLTRREHPIAFFSERTFNDATS